MAVDSIAESLAQSEPPPRIYHPKAIRAGLTAAIQYSESDGHPLAVILEGIDDQFRPMHLKLGAATVVALAAFCARTLEVDDRA